MQIYYCESCGLRISDDQVVKCEAVFEGNLAFCSTCRPPQGKAQGNNAIGGNRIVLDTPTKAAGKRSGSRLPSLGSVGIAPQTNFAPPPVHHPIEPHPRPKAQVQAARQQAWGSGVVIGSGLTALALCGLFYVFSMKKAETAAPPPAPETVTAAPTASVNQQPAAKTPEPAPAKVPVTPERPSAVPAPPPEDPREAHAKKRWAELKSDAERNHGGSVYLKKEIKEFSEIYSNTASGKEAAIFYKNIASTDLPPPTDKVFADFRKDYKQYSPAEGWKYLWNANGSIGDSSKYVALVWNPQTGFAADAKNFPHTDPAGCVSISGVGGHPGRGVSQGSAVDRYAIAAYTLQAGQSGRTALAAKIARTDTKNSGQIDFRVYVNDTLKKNQIIGSGKGAAELSVDLGVLKEGDTVVVAVGPDREDSSDLFTMDFTIYPISSVPAGSPGH